MKRHPLLTLALVIDLMFAWGVFFATLLVCDYLGVGGTLEAWEPLAVAGGAVLIDAIAWFHVRWALLLRAGGAFAIAVFIAKEYAAFHQLTLWLLVGQQVLVAPVFLLSGWMRR